MAVAAVGADVPAAGRVVMVAGATGLVGRAVLAALSADKRNRDIHVVGRRAPATLPAGAQFHVHQVAFAHLPALPPVDDVYIALGTTIKVAGSQAAFRAVDHDAVLALARQARRRCARNLAVVSAMGADAPSRIFYNRVKGETEHALRALGYATLVIARPSMLDGDRAALASTRTAWRTNRSGRHGAVCATDTGQLPGHLQRPVLRGDGPNHCARPGTQVLLSGQMQA